MGERLPLFPAILLMLTTQVPLLPDSKDFQEMHNFDKRQILPMYEQTNSHILIISLMSIPYSCQGVIA